MSWNRLGRIFIAVAIGALWIGLRILSLDAGPTALLSDGPLNPAHPLVTSELPNEYLAPGAGFDGAQYYAIARAPFSFEQTARYLDVPTYRMRRILHPLLAGAIAPAGGIALVWAFAGVSLVGVAIGAWALDTFPGAPKWLGLMTVLTRG